MKGLAQTLTIHGAQLLLLIWTAQVFSFHDREACCNVVPSQHHRHEPAMEVTQLIPGLISALSAPISLPDPEIQIIYIGYLPLRASEDPVMDVECFQQDDPAWMAVWHSAPKVIPDLQLGRSHVLMLLSHSAPQCCHTFTWQNKPPDYFSYFDLNPI